MNKLSLDEDIKFESDGGIHIGKYIKVEKGAVYNDQGYVTVNNYPDESSIEKKGTAKDDDDIGKAIAELYETTGIDGKRIFVEQGQWYAVYRVLKTFCNFPEKMTDFAEVINKNGFAEQEPRCKYNSIKAAKSDLPLLSVKVSLWQQYNSVNDKYKKQCEIAEKLMKLLGLID